MITKILAILTPFASLFAIGGLLLRLLDIRDRVWGLSMLFYATPWIVIALASAFACVGFWALRKLRLCAVHVWLTAVALVLWSLHSFRVSPPAPEPAASDCNILFWNAAHPKVRLQGRLKLLTSINADIYGIAESKTFSRPKGEWPAAFPGRHFTVGPAGMLLITSEPFEILSKGRIGPYSHYFAGKTTVRGQTVGVVFADLVALPWKSRARAFRELHKVLAELPLENVCLMGDFNTPRDSVFFDAMRPDWISAPEARGQGWIETWPAFTPLLGIDHLWSRGMRPVDCRMQSTIYSDHRMIIGRFAL